MKELLQNQQKHGIVSELDITRLTSDGYSACLRISAVRDGVRS